ncbi:hypothetical protein CRE_17952 [Caenorhabditis remanei]|uniref:Uncharacterized protein n=1 Tax=Caenorhabditis remanei TaxID=31234 RepID=E3MDR1_CAERE|nr:hypothetical protein CRE_17952 [Caenorhabditis remanei]
MPINDTLFPNESDPSESIWRTETSYIVIMVSLLCQWFLFPFYAYVSIKNRKREKNTPLYPILNILFKMSILFYLSTIAITLTYLWHKLILNIYRELSPLSKKLFLVFFMPLLFTVWESIKVYHTILSLLALQRFLIYFYPETEKKVAVGRRTTNVITCVLYLIFFIQELYPYYYKNSGFPHLHEILSIILILSALLYIPMFISVRKQSSLMSAQMNKPHMFIIWQTIAVCIGKIFYLEPMYLHYVRNLTEKDYQSLLADINLMLIPLIIQVVYLGSTKQNLDLLSVRMKNLFRTEYSTIKKNSFNPERSLFEQISEYVILAIQLTIFPLYAYIYIKNRKRDRNTPLHSVISVSFKMNVFFYAHPVVMFVFLKVFSHLRLPSIIMRVVFLIKIGMFFALTGSPWECVKVYHIVMSLLAIRQFVLYFYPDKENYVTYSSKITKWIVFLIFIALSIQDIVFAVRRSNSPRESIFYGFPHIHEILTGLLIVSVLFYIPIIVSVRKMGHLMSARMSRPQMFIFWQSLAVCIGKILYLGPAYFYYFTKETNELNYLAELARLDIVMIQLLNQMTYIGCNRQNLQFLYRIVKKCLMKLFCKGSSVQIQPYVINNDGGMETTQQSSPLN